MQLERINRMMNLKYYFFIPFVVCLHLGVFAQPKNVLFIAIDDLKPMLGSYGYEKAITPNIDNLADAGTVFLNAHCQQALCGPSRVSVLTGLYPDTTGIYGMQYKMRQIHPNILTLPQYFKNMGYVTIGTGKIFDPRNVEDDWNGPQDKISWTKFFGKNPYNTLVGGPIYGGHYHDSNLKELSLTLEEEGREKGLRGKELRFYVRDHGGGPATEAIEIPDDAYKDGAIANRGIQQLEHLKDAKQPFFLALGFLKPHLPFVAPKKYWDLYDRDSLDLATIQNYPKGAPSFAETDYIEARGYSGVPKQGAISESTQRELMHGYLACISYIDAQIGKVLDKLRETGLYDNTVIVLWGDHGFHLGDKQIWGKHTNYEEATRCPLIFANTGRPKGESNQPVNLIDIFPTLCEVAGIQIPQGLDGESLMPIIRNPLIKIHDFAASIYPRSGYYGVAIRTDRYRFVGWYRGWKKEGRNGVELAESPSVCELYDYNVDQPEKSNLVDDPKYSKVAKELYSFLDAHVRYTQKKQLTLNHYE